MLKLETVSWLKILMVIQCSNTIGLLVYRCPLFDQLCWFPNVKLYNLYIQSFLSTSCFITPNISSIVEGIRTLFFLFDILTTEFLRTVFLPSIFDYSIFCNQLFLYLGGNSNSATLHDPNIVICFSATSL